MASGTGQGMRPFDRLFTEDRRPVKRADAILERGWESRGLPPLRLAPPLPWDGTLSANRAWGTAIHGWDPLAPLLGAHDETGRDPYLAQALDVALDWIAVHRAGAPVWRELAAGRRAHRLAYLYDAAAHAGLLTDPVRARLRESLELHLAEIAAAEKLAAAPSIALEQAAGQLSIARRCGELRGAQAARSLAHARLSAYFDARVAPDGGPLEHSPGVLWPELLALHRLFASELLDDSALRELMERALEGLAWFVTPAGSLVPFGDTDGDATASIDPGDVADDAARLALSGGRDGAPPGLLLRAFPTAGYAVVRAPHGKRSARASYLAQAASFHSTRHKHADELSFVWHDDGVELLTDPGRYGLVGRNPPGSEAAQRGFRYSDPQRTYVESTGAHNTVEIDGRSDARVRSRAYGSAILRTAQGRDAFAVESAVRREGVSHTRLLALRPRNWLLVLDVLGGPGIHDLLQRFHFGPEVDLSMTGRRGSATLPGGRRLDVLPLIGAGEVRAAHGQSSPELLGWVSPRPLRMEPVWALGIAAAGVRRHVFATALVLSDGGAEPVPELIRSNPSGRRVRVGWEADGRRHQIDLATDGEELSLRHRAPAVQDS